VLITLPLLLGGTLLLLALGAVAGILIGYSLWGTSHHTPEQPLQIEEDQPPPDTLTHPAMRRAGSGDHHQGRIVKCVPKKDNRPYQVTISENGKVKDYLVVVSPENTKLLDSALARGALLAFTTQGEMLYPCETPLS